MFGELKTASLLQKLRTNNPTTFDAHTVPLSDLPFAATHFQSHFLYFFCTARIVNHSRLYFSHEAIVLVRPFFNSLLLRLCAALRSMELGP
jgi:hypothetical protein